MEKRAQFDIYYEQFLEPSGILKVPRSSILCDDGALRRLHEAMVQTRVFDAKAIALQRTGRMGTYASSLGLEAVSVPIGLTMRKEDVFCPYYRDYGTFFARGVRMEEVLLYWGGDERGSDFQNAREDFPIAVPIASQCLHATGVAFAFQYRQEPRVAVTTVGDGGTSKGDFYSAINLAGVWNLPVVFVINNNQWAISVPLKNQTRAQTLAQKGIAAGIPVVQVDGCDPLAMQSVMTDALDRARSGQGPSLIEAISYRLPDHTTADDASRYRDPAEVKQHESWDPMIRFETWLLQAGIVTSDHIQETYSQADRNVEQAIEAYLNTPPPPVGSMFQYLYETLPEGLWDQQAIAVQFAGDPHD